MGRQYINQFSEGENINQVFANGKQLRPNRQNLSVALDNLEALTQNAMECEPKRVRRFKSDYVIIKGTLSCLTATCKSSYSNSKRPMNRVDEADFVTLTNENIGQLIVQLRQFVDSISHPQLQSLCQQYLDNKDIMEKFSQAPAGVKNHHAYRWVNPCRVY